MPGELEAPALPVVAPRWFQPTGSNVFTVEATAGGKVLLGLEDGRLQIRSLADGELVWETQFHRGSVLAAGFSASEKYFASVGEDGYLFVSSVEEEKVILEHPLSAGWAEHLAWSPVHDILVAAGGKKRVGYDAARRQLTELMPAPSSVAAVAWLDGSRFGTAGYGGLDLFRKGEEAPYRRHAWKGSLLSLSFSPRQSFAACGAQDLSIHVWDLHSAESMAMSGFEAKPKQLSFHHSGNYMANAAGADLILWDYRNGGPSGKEPKAFGPLMQPIQALEFQPEGDLVFTADKEGAVVFWDPLHSSMPIALGGVLKNPVSVARWDKRGRAVITGLSSGYVGCYVRPG